jgi:hypothetical protein
MRQHFYLTDETKLSSTTSRKDNCWITAKKMLSENLVAPGIEAGPLDL